LVELFPDFEDVDFAVAEPLALEEVLCPEDEWCVPLAGLLVVSDLLAVALFEELVAFFGAVVWARAAAEDTNRVPTATAATR